MLVVSLLLSPGLPPQQKQQQAADGSLDAARAVRAGATQSNGNQSNVACWFQQLQGVGGLAALGRWSLKVTGAFPRAFLETFVAELCPPPPLPPLSLAWPGSSGALVLWCSGVLVLWARQSVMSACHLLSGPSVPFPLSFAQAAATPTPTTVSPKKKDGTKNEHLASIPRPGPDSSMEPTA